MVEPLASADSRGENKVVASERASAILSPTARGPFAIPLPKEPPSFLEWFSIRFAQYILFFILGLTAIFLLLWWFGIPTVEEVDRLFGETGEPRERLEALRSLRKEHFDQYRDLFQILVLSGLTPLFTMLAGYAFGARQRKEKEEEEE